MPAATAAARRLADRGRTGRSRSRWSRIRARSRRVYRPAYRGRTGAGSGERLGVFRSWASHAGGARCACLRAGAGRRRVYGWFRMPAWARSIPRLRARRHARPVAPNGYRPRRLRPDGGGRLSRGQWLAAGGRSAEYRRAPMSLWMRRMRSTWLAWRAAVRRRAGQAGRERCRSMCATTWPANPAAQR